MAESADDLNLPNAVIGRIIKEALPPNTNVSKQSRLAISKAASVFVLYCTSCANQFALDQKRKTLKDIDIFHALEEMELDCFVPELKSALEKFKVAKNEKKKAKEAANQSGEMMNVSTTKNEEVVNGDH